MTNAEARIVLDRLLQAWNVRRGLRFAGIELKIFTEGWPPDGEFEGAVIVAKAKWKDEVLWGQTYVSADEVSAMNDEFLSGCALSPFFDSCIDEAIRVVKKYIANDT